MIRIASFVGRSLTWVQPSTYKHWYELRSGEQAIATLRLKNIFSSTATSESEEGSCTFERHGVLNKFVTVRVEDKDTTVATYRENKWKRGGTLELPEGKKLLFTMNFWKSLLEVKTETGETLIHFTIRGVFRLRADVEIRHRAGSLAELPWLVMLGWYVVVMAHRDRSRAAAG
ncbi:MAG TPA: hypothetical protein DCP63_14515 [Bacteroidetes bacterium]|nr:hypothetical protein [Bacteroidota bacterium]